MPQSNPLRLRHLLISVVTTLGTKAQMGRSINLLNCIAELRKTKETAAFFTTMGAEEQFEWVKEALTRIDFPQQDSPAICILDSGVNNEHPLLRPALDAYDMHAYDPACGAKLIMTIMALIWRGSPCMAILLNCSATMTGLRFLIVLNQ